MNILDARAEGRKASQGVLSEVIQLGTDQGLFQMIRSGGEADPWRHVTVQTPAGHVFSFMAGSWNKEAKISCTLAEVRSDGLTVRPSEACEWLPGSAARETVPEAAVSYSRGAAVVLRELVRRVIKDPAAISLADRVNLRMKRMQEERTGLRAHVAQLASMGYRFPRHKEDETYEATGVNDLDTMPRQVRVTNTGHITFEAQCHVDKFAAIVAALKA